MVATVALAGSRKDSRESGHTSKKPLPHVTHFCEIWQPESAGTLDVQALSDHLMNHGIQGDRITSKNVTQARGRAASILDEARSAGYGKVVMGRRGLSRVYGFLTGRVTHKVLLQGEGLAFWICPANPKE